MLSFLCISGGVSDPSVWEALQGGLEGRKNDYVAVGCGGVIKREEKSSRG
jgi:hypothetical protein